MTWTCHSPFPAGLFATYYAPTSTDRAGTGQETAGLCLSVDTDLTSCTTDTKTKMINTEGASGNKHAIGDVDSTSRPSGMAGAFVARWEGLVRPPYAELYTFQFTMADATKEDVRIWVDNDLIINDFETGAVTGNKYTS